MYRSLADAGVASMRELMDKGGPVMWPLLACSLVSLMVTIERFVWQWRQRRRRDNGLGEQIIEHASRGRFGRAAELGKDTRDATAHVLAAGIRDHEHGLAEAMQISAEAHLSQMRRGLGVLDTIITLAPLLGILGTVVGIIQSFDLLGQAGIEQPREVVGGIAQALITTAAGLTIAVLTLLPFNWFVSRVQHSASELQTLATRLEIACRRGTEARSAAK